MFFYHLSNFMSNGVIKEYYVRNFGNNSSEQLTLFSSSLTTTSSLELVMEEAGQVGGRRVLEGATSTSLMAVETSTSRPVGQPPPSHPHPKIGPQTKGESRPNTSKAKGKRHMFEFHTFWHVQTRILLLRRESAEYLNFRKK